MTKDYQDLMPGVHYENRSQDEKGEYLFLDLGHVHGYHRTLKHYPNYRGTGASRTILLAGCHVFTNERQARKYWKDNKNPDGVQRPHAEAAINYAAAICATNGWKW